MKNFRKFDKNIGTDSMHIIGYPRSGKSVHAIQNYIKCLGQGEIGLWPGRRFCEWRHMDNYPVSVKKITIIIPEGTRKDIIPFNIPSKYLNWIEEDYNEIDIMEYLEPGEVTVLYDACFDRIDRAWLWVSIFDQIISRLKHHDIPIVFLDNEAGITFPQSAAGSLWEPVDRFGDIFVDFGKSYVRCVLLSQLETELYWKIREKCIWKEFRLCLPGKHSVGKPIRKYVRRVRRDSYHLFYGALYTVLNSNDKIKEKKLLWKMIPRVKIQLKRDPPSVHNNNLQNQFECNSCGYEWKSKVTNPLSCPKCKQYFGFKVNESETYT